VSAPLTRIPTPPVDHATQQRRAALGVTRANEGAPARTDLLRAREGDTPALIRALLDRALNREGGAPGTNTATDPPVSSRRRTVSDSSGITSGHSGMNRIGVAPFRNALLPSP